MSYFNQERTPEQAAQGLISTSVTDAKSSIECALSAGGDEGLLATLWQAVQIIDREDPKLERNRTRHKMFWAYINRLAHGWNIQVHFREGSHKCFTKQGRASACKMWGLLKSGAKKVEYIDPYTRSQWERCYGRHI
jgi:hypothetical protein